MKISVVLATYNGEKYLEEQLASIINQSRKPDQVIITDDQSTDGTWDILLKWKNQFPEIIELYRQDKNVGFNENFMGGLYRVKGDYVALSDQDDVWYQNKLFTLEEYATRNPHIIMFHHSEEYIDGNSVAIVNPGSSEDKDHWLPFEGRGVGLLFVFNRLTGHVLFFKKSLLDIALPIPNFIIYDWWLNVNVATIGDTMYIPEKLMQYRSHMESAYFSDVSKQLSNVTVPIRKALERFTAISSLSPADLKIGNKFLHLYQKHKPHTFDIRMFLFFLKNKEIFFKDFHIRGSFLRRKFFSIRLCRAYSKW